MTDLAFIRSQLSETTDSLTTLRQRRAALLTELSNLETQEQALSTQAATLQAEIKRLEPRPQDVERLARLTETLRFRLSKAPPRSPTAQRVKATLERLDDSHVPVSSRLSLVRSLLDDLQRHHQLDREVWDSREGASAAHRVR